MRQSTVHHNQCFSVYFDNDTDGGGLGLSDSGGMLFAIKNVGGCLKIYYTDILIRGINLVISYRKSTYRILYRVV